jgi:leucyl aminopeptidase (aminopeptidase T)
MNDIELLRRAVFILENCLLVKPKENVLILSDESIAYDLTKVLASAAAVLGAEPQTMCYVPQRWIFEREFCKFGGGWKLGETLPKAVTAAMGASNAVVLITSDMDVFFSLSLKVVLQKGVRIIILPFIYNKGRFLRLMPDTLEIVQEIKEATERYFSIVDRSKYARITSPAGTNLEFTLGNHKTGCNKGVVGEGPQGFIGGMELLPAGQVLRVPDKGSANGTVILNRSLMAHEFRKLNEPVELTVKDGYVVNIKGGIEAERLRDFLASWNDPEIYNLTELTIGTNPQCKFAGLCAIAEDTRRRGQVNIALGNDTHLGGNTYASCHIDSTMWYPSLELDGKLVVEKGKLLC